MLGTDVIPMWNELKQKIDALEADVHKGIAGNGKAAHRARRGLQDIKKHVHEIYRIIRQMNIDRKNARNELREHRRKLGIE